MKTIRTILMFAYLLSLLGCGPKLPPDPNKPTFFPASPNVFEYQKRELKLVAEKLGTNLLEYPQKAKIQGRKPVFEALQLLCSWKYINQVELTQIERYTLNLDSVRIEVNNGGFHQYFSNSSGDDWDIILWGLQESHDEEGLRRFNEVLSVFPHGRPFRNRVHRNRQLDALGERQWKVFDSFDKDFYEKPFPDFERSWGLILSQIQQYRPTWPNDIEKK
jgi:hypothetical protein